MTIAAMDRGEAGAAAGTCCPVTSDIHAALCIIAAAADKTVELALVNRCGWRRDLRRARAFRNRHRACDQQQPKEFIHGTGPIDGLGVLFMDYSTYSVDTTNSGGWSIESLSTKLIPWRKGRCIV